MKNRLLILTLISSACNPVKVVTNESSKENTPSASQTADSKIKDSSPSNSSSPTVPSTNSDGVPGSETIANTIPGAQNPLSGGSTSSGTDALRPTRPTESESEAGTGTGVPTGTPLINPYRKIVYPPNWESVSYLTSTKTGVLYGLFKRASSIEGKAEEAIFELRGDNYTKIASALLEANSYFRLGGVVADSEGRLIVASQSNKLLDNSGKVLSGVFSWDGTSWTTLSAPPTQGPWGVQAPEFELERSPNAQHIVAIERSMQTNKFYRLENGRLVSTASPITDYINEFHVQDNGEIILKTHVANGTSYYSSRFMRYKDSQWVPMYASLWNRYTRIMFDSYVLLPNGEGYLQNGNVANKPCRGVLRFSLESDAFKCEEVNFEHYDNSVLESFAVDSKGNFFEIFKSRVWPNAATNVFYISKSKDGRRLIGRNLQQTPFDSYLTFGEHNGAIYLSGRSVEINGASFNLFARFDGASWSNIDLSSPEPAGEFSVKFTETTTVIPGDVSNTSNPNPTPVPVVSNPTPSPTPEPVVTKPTPSPTPEPVVTNPTPTPTPTLDPVIPNPGPEPIVLDPTPTPITDTPKSPIETPPECVAGQFDDNRLNVISGNLNLGYREPKALINSSLKFAYDLRTCLDGRIMHLYKSSKSTGNLLRVEFRGLSLDGDNRPHIIFKLDSEFKSWITIGLPVSSSECAQGSICVDLPVSQLPEIQTFTIMQNTPIIPGGEPRTMSAANNEIVVGLVGGTPSLGVIQVSGTTLMRNHAVTGSMRGGEFTLDIESKGTPQFGVEDLARFSSSFEFTKRKLVPASDGKSFDVYPVPYMGAFENLDFPTAALPNVIRLSKSLCENKDASLPLKIITEGESFGFTFPLVSDNKRMYSSAEPMNSHSYIKCSGFSESTLNDGYYIVPVEANPN